MPPNGVQVDFATKEERGNYVHAQLFAAVWPNKTAADDKPGAEGLKPPLLFN